MKNAADPEVQGRALAALAGLGEARTRAVVAMLRGVERGTLGGRSVRAMMESSDIDDQGHLFIDLIKDEVSSAWTKEQVIRHLDVSDSQVVHDYLLERLGNEEHRHFAAGIVMTLGRMKEVRAVPVIRKRLVKGDGPHDIYSLIALGSIGGREAGAVLVDYLRREKLVHVDRAINALAKIDANLARGEAQAILDRPDASNLPASTLEILRQHAGRSK